MEKNETLKKKYIELLQKQKEKLKQENFDIEAWKSSAVVILGRIFGPQDLKLKHIMDLRVDYGSSWSMRAVSGDYDPVESAKRQCEEVLDVAIHEIELFDSEVISPARKILENILGEKLTANQLKNLMSLSSDDPDALNVVKKNLKSFKNDDYIHLMHDLLTNLG